MRAFGYAGDTKTRNQEESSVWLRRRYKMQDLGEIEFLNM